MKYDKSLQDVWKWKAAVYEDIKDLHGEDLIGYFRQQSKNLKEKYHLRLKRIDPSISRHK